MTQSTIRVDGANMVEVKVVDDDHKISWKQSGQGRCEFSAKAHTNAEWLALFIEESPYGVNARNRATFATLDKPAALSLRNMLCDVFGEPPAKINDKTKDAIAKLAALVHLRDELRTHIDSFRDGLECAAKLDGNPDNRAYWKHEVKALGDIEAALNKTLGLCEKCGLPECTGECNGY